MTTTNKIFFAKSKFFIYFVVSVLGLGFLFISQNFFPFERKNSEFSTLEFSVQNTENKIDLQNFNPNNLSENDWQKLGFSEKQAKTILKYKNICGGKFSSKNQFKKCYAVSDEKYLQLEAFILLPKTSENAYTKGFSKYSKKEISVRKKFNPDDFSKTDWQNLGFSEKQSEAILKYKNYLGGSFISKEKFKECFIISEENFAKLEAFILLPEKTPENFEKHFSNVKTEKPKIQYADFNPNELDSEGWQKLGFSEKQATVILNYKNKILKGNFKTDEDLKNCFVVSEEKFEEMKPFLQIKTVENPIKTEVSEYSKNEIASKTDFSKIDLNEITFKQLREFGFDEKAAGSFIGFRKKLGGFVSKDQILETYNIDKNLTENLLEISPLNSGNVQKHTLLDAPEQWMKEHPYFKYYADKIVYYRISFQDEKKIFKNLKLKPETEAKMRLYLKS
ncbi:MAG: helix-hairpin-helix domain-containing protein [Flavobacteriaceae bacterium]|nr:helix-hairpin-helix domain-containing protein [Flavobacteriaceae bacterium]